MAADRRGVTRAVAALAAGRLILHPTETIVSLTGDPQNPVAVERARRVKGYERSRPFLCLVADAANAKKLARSWSPAAERLSERFWPGPLTLVVPVAGQALAPVTTGGTLAIRVASDPVSLRLLEAWDRPIFSTSANRRGDDPTVRVEDAVRQLADTPGTETIELALRSVAPGQRGTTDRPSTIVDVSRDPPRLVRSGAIDMEQLREAVPGLS